MKILLDAMGGDNAPEAVILGAVKAINEIEANIVLIGNKDIINNKVKELYKKDSIQDVSPRIEIYHTTQRIEMEDIPTQAIKQKKDSSMVVGFQLLNQNAGDVFVSAGNSGALLTGATLLVGRIKGIDRPAIAPMLPAYKKALMLIDAGANTNCKPINLVQFAQMADIYIRNTYQIERPKIGLLNIGTEENKGNELIKEVYKNLQTLNSEGKLNFAGNVEGRDAFNGDIDAIVTDGFTGNVFLKTIEGIGRLVKTTLTDSLKKNILRIICALPAMPAINELKKTLDYRGYGGALFLGIKKPVVKAHGSSDEYSFYCTIKQAEQFAKSKSVDRMIQEFQKLGDEN